MFSGSGCGLRQQAESPREKVKVPKVGRTVWVWTYLRFILVFVGVLGVIIFILGCWCFIIIATIGLLFYYGSKVYLEYFIFTLIN